MNLEATTFVELLVVGLQVATWLFLLIASLFGSRDVAIFSTYIKGLELLFTAFLLSFAYLLGVIFDRAFNSLVGWFENRCTSDAAAPPPRICSDSQAHRLGLHPCREYVIATSDNATAQLAYMRSRIRILRSSLINIPLIALCSFVLIGARGLDRLLRVQITTAVGVAGLFLTLVSIVAYRHLTASYWSRVQDFYWVLHKG